MTNTNAYIITFKTTTININAPRNGNRFVRGMVVKTIDEAREQVAKLSNNKNVVEIISVRDRSGKNFLAELVAQVRSNPHLFLFRAAREFPQFGIMHKYHYFFI